MPDESYHLPRPYATITPDDHTRRLVIRVRTEDWHCFTSSYPVPGAIEAIITTLIHGIANELRTNGFTSWSPSNQRRFVAHIRRCATLGLAPVPIPRDDAGEGETTSGTTPQLAEEPRPPLIEDDGWDVGETFGPEGKREGGEGRKPFS